MSILKAVLGAVTAPLAELATTHIKRKQAKDAIDGNVKMAKVTGDNQVKIDVADWERLSKAQEDKTWKDEYVTVSVFSLFNIVVFGSVAAALGLPEGAAAVEGVTSAIAELNKLDGVVADLLYTVGFAAVGIKVVRGLR